MQAPHANAHSPNVPNIRLYQNWLLAERGLVFDDYNALWQWSVTHLDEFWQSVFDYFEVQSPTPHSAVLVNRGMPDVDWFPGAQVNYAAQVLRHVKAAHAAGFPAIVSDNEAGEVRTLSWPDLQAQVASVALTLRDLGVQRGDRVAAYMPNVPETMVACLACMSIGAVWSVCAPDMGTPAVLGRFSQITPKVLIAVESVRYGGRTIDKFAVVDELCAGLASVEHVIVVPSAAQLREPRNGTKATNPDNTETLVNDKNATNKIANKDRGCWTKCLNHPQTAQFEPEWLPFDHPIWIVYSSGTTGLPKPIVHGHGGIVMTLLALKSLGNDIGCSYSANNWGERFHWYSSTGWVMWNAQMAGLANGSTICIYDGNPAGRAVDDAGQKLPPDWATLWRFAARHGVTWFGAGAAFFASCQKSGLQLADCGDLRAVRAIGSTGSPLSAEAHGWIDAQFAQVRPQQAPVWVCNISGGTDFCGAFIGGNRELPVAVGEMQCRLLGCAVESWSESGQSVVGAVGELVCTQPIPSMPLYFWNDPGKSRYLSSYFDTYPGVWRHGDWLQISAAGACTIYGRSDATINRQGLRMGTSEIYAAVEALPEVLDSLVIDLEYLGRESDMPLFVVLQPGCELSDAVVAKINGAIRQHLSPRFVPSSIHAVQEVPRTLSGKKQELPIKKLLLGQDIEKVVNRDVMANPASLDWFVSFAASRSAMARPAGPANL